MPFLNCNKQAREHFKLIYSIDQSVHVEFWGAEKKKKKKFMLTMLHNMNIMQYINFVTMSLLLSYLPKPWLQNSDKNQTVRNLNEFASVQHIKRQNGILLHKKCKSSWCLQNWLYFINFVFDSFDIVVKWHNERYKQCVRFHLPRCVLSVL